jgi:hypothetical protein
VRCVIAEQCVAWIIGVWHREVGSDIAKWVWHS